MPDLVPPSPLANVFDALKEILDDAALPRSVRNIIQQTIATLEHSSDNVSINRALSLLEDVADNVNMQSDHRSKLFNIVSLLETV